MQPCLRHTYTVRIVEVLVIFIRRVAVYEVSL